MNRELFSKISIHPTLWIVIGIAVVTAHFMELLLLFSLIFIHEMGHATAARFFSWRIKKISLLPFGGVAEMDEHGNRPLKEELIVVLAGPAQHIWLILAGYICYQFAIIDYDSFSIFLYYNVMILVFNLIPIWPLDGGKILFIILSTKKPFLNAFAITLMLSAAVIVFLTVSMIVIEPINLNLWIVILYLSFMLWGEWKQRHYVFMRFLLERYYGKQKELQSLIPIKVDDKTPIIHVLQRFRRGVKHPLVLEKDGKEMGTLDENELLHAYFTEKMTSATVGDLLYSY